MTLQVVELPNGRFMIVISGGGVSGDDEDRFKDLKESTGACAVLVSEEPVEVCG